MPTGRINKTNVDALFAKSGHAFLWDEDLSGFGVRASASGAKSYVVQYRLGGRSTKARRYTIGRHGSPWTADTARTEAKRLLIEVGQGIRFAFPRTASRTLTSAAAPAALQATGFSYTSSGFITSDTDIVATGLDSCMAPAGDTCHDVFFDVTNGTIGVALAAVIEAGKAIVGSGSFPPKAGTSKRGPLADTPLLSL
jgi:hypothetical protein